MAASLPFRCPINPVAAAEDLELFRLFEYLLVRTHWKEFQLLNWDLPEKLIGCLRLLLLSLTIKDDGDLVLYRNLLEERQLALACLALAFLEVSQQRVELILNHALILLLKIHY
jgi:hypothetical protein